MKNLTTLLFVLGIYCQFSYTQSVGIAKEEIVPHESAALEIRSSEKGLLIPRLTYVQRHAISNPAVGLLVFQTDGTPGFYYSDGAEWFLLHHNGSITDSDPNNEIQTISKLGDTLFLSKNGGQVVIPSNGAGGGGTDEQTLSISGDTLSISNGNSIKLPSKTDNLGNHEATQNILLHGYYLSADGDNEGLTLATNGNASFSHDINVLGDANLDVLNVTSTVNLGLKAIQATELDTSSVTNSKIADNAITNAKIRDAQITANKLHPMGASTDQFLRFDGATWSPASISSGLNFIGTWDASTNIPVISNITGLNGQYYIVSVAGSQNLGSGVISFNVGDWAIHDGTSYQKINSSNDVNSVFGRKGIVSAQYGDYTWNLLDLTNSDINDLNNVDASTATAGNLLIGDGSNWVSSSVTGDISLDGTGNMQIKNSVINLNHLQDATGADNTILKWNGSVWEEALLSSVEADGDPTNEIQTLGFSSPNLSISGGNSVSLAELLDNTDSQDLSLSGTTLSLTNDATPVDLSSIAGTNTDDQDLTLSNDTLYIEDGNEVFLGPYKNTDNQTLGFTSPNLFISNGNAISLAELLDNTDNQDLSLSGTTLSLTNDATPVDLSSIDTDEQTLGFTSPYLSISDGNSVNLSALLDNTDAQDLSLSGTTLSLTNDATPVDLSSIDNDNQTLGFTSPNLFISGGNAISLAALLDNTDAQDLTLSGTTLSLTNDATPVNLSSLRDNLGNHNLTENLITGKYFISGDGDNEGIFILDNGSVGIGISKPNTDYALHITQNFNSILRIDNHNPSADGVLQLAMTNIEVPGASNDFVQFFNSTGKKIGQIEGNGGGIAYVSVSDIRLKENLIPTKYGLNTVLKMKVHDYNYIGSSKKQTGFAAQELYDVFPMAVSVGGENFNTDPWSVDYSKLTPVLVKAVQEMNEKLTLLESENKKLEKKNSELKKALEKLELLEQKILKLEKNASEY